MIEAEDAPIAKNNLSCNTKFLDKFPKISTVSE